MDNITISVTVDNKNNMVVQIDDEDSITIETAGDIDLSEYVRKLTVLLDKRPKLSVKPLDIEDPKLFLIYETIENISIMFNESINQEVDEKEDEID